MITRQFATAAEAEAAFYEALERGDLEAVMAVWATDEEVICIHPGGPRIEGYDAIRDSWRQVFSQGNRLRFRLTDLQCFDGMLYSLHVVCEWVAEASNPSQSTPVFASNAYLLTDRGWRMVLHHASPAPQHIPAQEDPRDARVLLH
jgi:ketosteroid isomerase-like protein